MGDGDAVLLFGRSYVWRQTKISATGQFRWSLERDRLETPRLELLAALERNRARYTAAAAPEAAQQKLGSLPAPESHRAAARAAIVGALVAAATRRVQATVAPRRRNHDTHHPGRQGGSPAASPPSTAAAGRTGP